MPVSYLAILLVIVIAASGVTIAIGYGAGISLALPALIAAIVARRWFAK